ncbi:MAG: transcriptional repressor LexA [Planctomycetota bacterium]
MFYTDRQLAVLEFLQHYRKMRGLSPTLEEIAQNFGVSRVTIHDHVRQLEKKGAIRREPNLARALEILDPDYADLPPDDAAGDDGEILPVEVLGSIAAGGPIEAVENPETVDLADLIPMGKEHYALRVRGMSMVDEGIRDGDLVIVERRQIADDGETVVAVLPENEVTLKKLYREPDAANSNQGRFRLQPANEALDPIYTDKVEVRGVVVGVVRKYRK